MNKSLILVQLYQEECNSQRLVSFLRRSPLDSQLAKLLARAETEHSQRAKDISVELDKIYGAAEWNQHIVAAGALAPDNLHVPGEAYNVAEAQERKLADLYRDAREVVKSEILQEADRQQLALLQSFQRMRTESTLKLKINLKDLLPPE